MEETNGNGSTKESIICGIIDPNIMAMHTTTVRIIKKNDIMYISIPTHLFSEA